MGIYTFVTTARFAATIRTLPDTVLLKQIPHGQTYKDKDMKIFFFCPKITMKINQYTSINKIGSKITIASSNVSWPLLTSIPILLHILHKAYSALCLSKIVSFTFLSFLALNTQSTKTLACLTIFPFAEGFC